VLLAFLEVYHNFQVGLVDVWMVEVPSLSFTVEWFRIIIVIVAERTN
jgi:hypothetical protein